MGGTADLTSRSHVEWMLIMECWYFSQVVFSYYLINIQTRNGVFNCIIKPSQIVCVFFFYWQITFFLVTSLQIRSIIEHFDFTWAKVKKMPIISYWLSYRYIENKILNYDVERKTIVSVQYRLKAAWSRGFRGYLLNPSPNLFYISIYHCGKILP